MIFRKKQSRRELPEVVTELHNVMLQGISGRMLLRCLSLDSLYEMQEKAKKKTGQPTHFALEYRGKKHIIHIFPHPEHQLKLRIQYTPAIKEC